MEHKHLTLDLTRTIRLGFPEAIFSEGKSVAQIVTVCRALAEHEQRALFTRLAEDKFLALPREHRQSLEYDPLSATAFFGTPLPLADLPEVAVVTAGTSDAPVAAEAARTLRFHGISSRMVSDVGVAGLHRLLTRLEQIQDLPVVIAVAGMDAALVSVLGGLVRGALIAVPTSVGYGAAAGGKTALAAILASCAPGVVTVNIDNGYGAAMAAIRILYKMPR